MLRFARRLPTPASTRRTSKGEAHAALAETRAAIRTTRESVSELNAALREWVHARDRARRALPRVLFVDDDPNWVGLVQRVLERTTPVEVVHVGTGLDGLEKLRAGAFDAVVLDVNLPGMPGYRVLEEMRQRSLRPLTPVVLCSGCVDDVLLTAAGIGGGASRVVHKDAGHHAVAEAVLVLLAAQDVPRPR